MSTTNYAPSAAWSMASATAPATSAAAAFVESVQELIIAAALAPVEGSGARYLPDTFLTRW